MDALSPSPVRCNLGYTTTEKRDVGGVDINKKAPYLREERETDRETRERMNGDGGYEPWVPPICVCTVR